MMAAHSRSFKIRVPATSANIGPGFDVVGLSLSLYLTLSVSVPILYSSNSNPSTAATAAAERPSISYTGQGADEVPLDAYKNLTTRVALYVLRCSGIQSFPPGLFIPPTTQLPFHPVPSSPRATSTP